MPALNDTLRLLEQHLAPTRQVVHAGELVYSIGGRFESLHVVRTGIVKLVDLTPDGRERLSGLRFRGDWLGFDALAAGVYGCDAVALDTGEVWSLRYDSLLQACAASPPLMQALNGAMSAAIGSEQERMAALCGLGADGRVADFLQRWAGSLASHGLRSDRFGLRVSRAEIGQHLGLTLESVSRAFSRLARERLIAFPERGRREVQITDVAALADFVQRHQVGATEALA